MEYSVETLAQLSGVSVRTLHYYDEIGLIKPAVRMVNGRRLYGTEQLLLLQEVLFFKEMGLSLRKIKSILGMKHLNKAAMMQFQKDFLLKEIQRLERLTKSIEQKVEHYKGCKMTNKQIAEQFDDYQNKWKDHLKLFDIHFGTDVVEKAKVDAKTISEEEVERYRERSGKLVQKIIEAFNTNLAVDSWEVQSLMKEQFEFMLEYQPVSKEEYLKAIELTPKLYERYQSVYPKLGDFIYKAQRVFAKRAFSV